jgi:DNA-binding PadR family transcriptional regulator
MKAVCDIIVPVDSTTLEKNDMERFDINELNPHQLFLLVLVEFGLATPYDLLSKAGMGVGLTSPALKRLKEAGLLTSTPGPRNRIRYAITKKGRKTLRENLQVGPLWQQGHTNVFESLPRGFILTWLQFGPEEARKRVDGAIHKLSVLQRNRQREAEEWHASMDALPLDTADLSPAAANGVVITTVYQWIKAECDAKLFRLQAKAMVEINKLLDSLGQAPQLPRDQEQP